MRLLTLLPFTLLTACGSSWTNADAFGATDNANIQLQIDAIVSDAGTTEAMRIRALDRAAFCNDTSMLFRHKLSAPDGGVKCTP